MAVVGIDLGTTMSAVAVVDQFGKAEIVPNLDGELTTPSVVLFESRNSKVVGTSAKNSLVSDAGLVVETVKNDMGKEATREFHGELYTPEQISAIILKRLKEDTEQALGQAIEGAVITVPAIFGETERHATRVAAEIAGLKVLSIIEEPVAAAIAYGFGDGDSRNRNGTLLIYDLGGGTFDITILKIEEGNFRMLATDGDRRLGGKDWDRAIVDFVAERFLAEHRADPREDPESRNALLAKAEAAKKDLTRRDTAKITCQHAGQSLRVELTREQFEHLTRDLLEQTETTMRLVVQGLQQSGSLSQGWAGIDKVLLVGGSSRMPQVTKMVRALAGKEPEMLEVDLVVAQGAALYSVMKVIEQAESTGNSAGLEKLGLPTGFEEMMSRVEVKRVCSFALGILALNEKRQWQNSLMVPMNSELPHVGTRVYGTASDNQQGILIHVMEGDDLDPKFCVELGNGEITGIKPGLPEGSPVEVTIGLDDESCILVHAVELTYGTECSFVVTRNVEMSRSDIERSKLRLLRDSGG